MHVCQVVAGGIDQIGGLERHVIDICNGLAERSRVTLVSHPNLETLIGPRVSFCPLDLGKNRWNPGNLVRLYRLIKGNDFDIVHTHANKATEITGFLKQFLDFKHVATIHGLKKNVKAFEKVDQLIAVSGKVASRVQKRSPEVIYNGISYDPSPPEMACSYSEWKGGSFVFGAIGRLVRVKGFDLLLKGFVGVDAKLLIAGDGPEREPLARLARDLGIAEKVLFVGHLENIDIVYNCIDVLVMPSRREGFPYVFVESLLREIPVVAADVSDVREFIGDNYVVEVENPQALHEKLVRSLNDYEQMKRDFGAAFRLARERLTCSSMMEQLVAVYRRVSKSSPSTNYGEGK